MSLQKRLDEVFSDFIRLKESDDNGWCRCFVCNNPIYWKSAVVLHYIKRTYKATRWDERNCHAGCVRCNGEEEKNTNLMLIHARKLIDLYGADIINQLAQLKQAHVHYSRFELEDKIKYYSQKVKELLKNKI